MPSTDGKPVRLQLSRHKGFNLQALSLATNGLPAVLVSRPGPWGNPFIAHDWRASMRAVYLGCRGDRAGRQESAVKIYRMWLAGGRRVRKDKRSAWAKTVMTVKVDRDPPSAEEIRAGLAGKNLACWCKPSESCHADVLLELANG